MEKLPVALSIIVGPMLLAMIPTTQTTSFSRWRWEVVFFLGLGVLLSYLAVLSEKTDLTQQIRSLPRKVGRLVRGSAKKEIPPETL